jgi:hypothetical protein
VPPLEVTLPTVGFERIGAVESPAPAAIPEYR